MWKRFLLLSSTLAFTHVAPTFAYSSNEDDLEEFRTKLTNEWMLVKNDRLHNIKTFAKQEDGKRFRSFKVEAVINTTFETITRVLLDFANYPRWYWEVREAKLLRKDSPTDYYFYMVHHAPYGLPDRDVILHIVIDPPTATRNSIHVSIRSEPDIKPLKPPLIRMAAENMHIKISNLTENQVLLEAEGYIDPSGKIPTWANNLIQRSAPYSILLSLQRMVQLDEYRQSKTALPFPIDNLAE
jgi:hypothetical protein